MTKEELTDLLLKFFMVKKGKIELRAIHLDAMKDLASIIITELLKDI